MTDKREHVFIATLGAAPQVVTLALDALLARDLPIRRVVVIHTSSALDIIAASLSHLHEEFQVTQYYGDSLLYAPHVLAHGGKPLMDVVTPEEIEATFESLYTLFRQHKQAGSKIHLSIAGGRKTLPVLAIAAAQLLFDHDDTVWHLISDPALMGSKAMHSESPDELSLMRLPFAYWRTARSDEPDKAREFIQQMLTPAEREIVVHLLREGLSNAALAERLGKSTKTIVNQLSSIYDKLRRHYGLPAHPDRTVLLALLGRSPYER